MTRYEFRRDVYENKLSEGSLTEKNDKDPPDANTKRIYLFEGRMAKVWNTETKQWDGEGNKFSYKADSLDELYKKLPDELKKRKE